MTRKTMTLATACLLSMPLLVKAGNLTVDNLTLYGGLEFANSSGGTASGGTITTNGNYVIHTFTTVGTNSFIVSSGSLTCDVLVVAGGGGGGNTFGGGGGAGGLVYATAISITGTAAVIVGEGGTGGTGLYTEEARGKNGSNSIFGGITALGGGGGGGHGDGGIANGKDGGSGGGGCVYNIGEEGGDGLQENSGGGTGYGNGGGSHSEDYVKGGGGGGAGATGGNGTTTVGGAGGNGLEFAISGSNVYYGGGGGGNGWDRTAGAGGNGGGGTGGVGTPENGGAGGHGAGYDGVANTGGGGGSGNYTQDTGGDGGSGIVIVRYPMPTNITETASIYGINQNSASATNIFLGKVGIGTNSPSEKLSVAGNIRVDGAVIMQPAGNLPMGVFTNQ